MLSEKCVSPLTWMGKSCPCWQRVGFVFSASDQSWIGDFKKWPKAQRTTCSNLSLRPVNRFCPHLYPSGRVSLFSVTDKGQVHAISTFRALWDNLEAEILHEFIWASSSCNFSSKFSFNHFKTVLKVRIWNSTIKAVTPEVQKMQGGLVILS